MKSRKRISIILMVLLIFSTVFSGIAFAKPTERINVIISFKQAPNASDMAHIRQFNGKIKEQYSITPAMAINVPVTALNGLKNNPNIISIDEDIQVHALSYELGNTWGVEHIGAGEVHSNNILGDNIKVAIIDSGVDYNHDDLVERFDFSDLGYDFVEDDSFPADVRGHGTHVAGTVAASANSNGVIGVAPNVQLISLRVLDADGSGNISGILSALQWVSDYNDTHPDSPIMITNNSYGTSSDPGYAFQDAFDSLNAQGVLSISSAGNSGRYNGRGDNVGYPAKYTSVVAVAATDTNDNRAYFSSTGPAVELAAPGVSILSTWNDSTSAYSPQPFILDEEYYKESNGTSMASPHVAGLAALVWSANPSFTNNQIRERLQNTAIDLGNPLWYGHGLIDAVDAVGAPQNDSPTVSISTPADLSSSTFGDPVTFTASATDTEDNNATLTAAIEWTSSLDGSIGSGGSFTTSLLSVGIHTITASVTDSGGATDSDQITITINPIPNILPTISIDSPINGYSVNEGTSITFTGTANDDEDGDISSNIVWTNGATNLGTGASVSATLPVGVHTITATITDNDGGSATDSISITVNPTPNILPTVSIESPSDGYSVDEGTSITFTGTANDVEDGNISSNIVWTNGATNLGTGASVSATLPVGVHTITATITDNDGGSATDSISITVNPTPNILPTVSIESPSDGYSVNEGTSITFTGTANDVEDGNISANIVWTNGATNLGTGAIVNTTLPVGVHTIAATITDNDGGSATDSISITVNPTPNILPTVSIDSPIDGHSVNEGTSITFTGTASDDEDGDISSNIVWTNGAINLGTGANVNATLPVGTHTITATITDSEGASDSDQISVTVEENIVEKTVYANTINLYTSGGRYKNAHLNIGITVEKAAGNVTSDASGAIVYATVLRNDSSYRSFTGTTDSTGYVSFKATGIPSGTYKLVITNIAYSDYTWDGNTPDHDPVIK